eukprot:Sdes_comp20915_c0_seq4m18264
MMPNERQKKRAHQYSLHLPVNPPRPDKKLLVLDIDYTIFDHKSSAESFSQLMRPNLIYFLESVYQHFDIIIWCKFNFRSFHASPHPIFTSPILFSTQLRPTFYGCKKNSKEWACWRAASSSFCSC